MDVARHSAASRQPLSTHKPVSKWLPSQRPGIQQWLACKLCEARERTDRKLDSSLVSFREVVNSDPTWETLSNDMFTQWSKNYDTGAEAALDSFDDFIEVLNIIVQSPSSFFDRHGPPPAMWMIGFPINAVLDWPMGTLAGYEFWLIPAINASFRNVLNTWTCFLRSSASQSGLKNWLYQDTLGMIAQVENGGHTCSPFHQIFVCDPTAPYYGFGTWDGFFRKPGNGLHPGL